MKKLKSIVLAVLALSIALSTAILPATNASAAGSASLSIVPKKTYVINPGQTITDTLTIRNIDSTNQLDLNLRVVDFTYNDDGGTPKLMLAEDAPQTTWSLKPFLYVPESVSIPPHGSKTVQISLKAPKNQGAGSYYSAIVYSTGAADGGNVGLSASGVTLVFTSIPGKVNEKLTLEKLGAYQQATAGSPARFVYVATTKPDSIAYTLNNQGNVTEAPVGSITLRDWFGHVTTINEVNPNQSLALIGQTRTFTACIKMQQENVALSGQTVKSTACASPSLWPGYYKISADLFYGQNGNNTQELTQQASFWYLPWWFVIIVIVGLVVLFIMGWLITDKVRGAMRGSRSKKVMRNWKR
jgi:hypothetical protein